jgi:16S rRNA (uracil1498-N3)-methyltransferase
VRGAQVGRGPEGERSDPMGEWRADDYTLRVSLPRFFVPRAEEGVTELSLPDEEAAHLTRVLRLESGDTVRLFNGRGQEWEATVAAVGKRETVVRLDRPVTPRPEPALAITLAVAVLKGDKMDDVVRDAVMLGVTEIRPVVTERTDGGVRGLERARRVGRWQRIAVASAKQCGRAVVPHIHEPGLLPDAWAASSAAVVRVVLVEPQAGVPTVTLAAVPKAEAIILFVGPEGGWTSAEVAHAVESGAVLVTLGSLTLRADAAPLVAIAAIRAALGEW